MKKLTLIILMLFAFTLSVIASDFAEIPYKNLKIGSKISYNASLASWSNKVERNKNYFVRTSEYELSDKLSGAIYNVTCEYMFLYNNKLIGYSNSTLKFYDIALIDNEVSYKELSEEEVKNLFPNYKIIKITDFSQNTNSIKIKKDSLNFKIIVLNNTDKDFANYIFTSGNSKFKKYPMAGFIDVTKKGMIQFSRYGENSKNTPWFIILVR